MRGQNNVRKSPRRSRQQRGCCIVCPDVVSGAVDAVAVGGAGHHWQHDGPVSEDTLAAVLLSFGLQSIKELLTAPLRRSSFELPVSRAADATPKPRSPGRLSSRCRFGESDGRAHVVAGFEVLPPTIGLPRDRDWMRAGAGVRRGAPVAGFRQDLSGTLRHISRQRIENVQPA